MGYFCSFIKTLNIDPKFNVFLFGCSKFVVYMPMDLIFFRVFYFGCYTNMLGDLVDWIDFLRKSIFGMENLPIHTANPLIFAFFYKTTLNMGVYYSHRKNFMRHIVLKNDVKFELGVNS